MTFTRQLVAAARLDLADLRRSRWMLFATILYAVLAATFVFAGLRESTMLGFTGMGRVLFSTCHALVLLLPLLALMATSQVVNRAREDGALELLFTLPLGRGAWFAAVSLVRLAALVLPLALLTLVLALVARVVFAQPMPWAFVARMLLVSTLLVAAYTALGLLISTAVKSAARATLWALLTWASSVALLDFGLVGLLLRQRVAPGTVLVLASLNPVHAARLALVSGGDHDLALLGPVGAFALTHVGTGGLFALGLAVPFAVAAFAWTGAWQLFRKGDLL